MDEVLLLEARHPRDSIFMHNTLLQVLECYVNINEWKDAETWYAQVNNVQSQYSPTSELHSALTLQSDLNQIRYYIQCFFMHVCIKN